MLRSELRQFAAAMQFLTRLPISKNLNPTSFELAHAIKYFPVVGLLLGLMIGLVSHLFSFFNIPQDQGAIILVACGIALTGAFHEDGVADSLDGLGGAFQRERKLEIMKDSRIGTYGATGLVLALLFRVALWNQSPQVLLTMIPLSWMWARSSSLPIALTTEYVSTGSSNKPILHQVTSLDMIFSSFVVLGFTFFMSDLKTLLILCFVNGACVFGLRKYFIRQVGGYTGDLLGGANVAIELLTAWVLIRLKTGT